MPKTVTPESFPTVSFVDGEPQGGVLKIETFEGGQIRFRVKSDAPEEVHVHGFDISKSVAAGGTATIDFKADMQGIYEAEMEVSGVPIAEIQVNP
ncbi:MAG: hypothetical protein WEB05_04985 [Solirubrobacterales bacterium]